jgi:predicted MPP superfamily phosphohydrolase
MTTAGLAINILLWVGLLIGHTGLCAWAVGAAHAVGGPVAATIRIGVASLLAAMALSAVVFGVAVFGWRGDLAGHVHSVVFAYILACNVVAWIAAPALGLIRATREWSTRGARRVEIVAESALGPRDVRIGAGRWNGLLRLPGNESLSLQVTRWDLAQGALAIGFEPLRILHISDLHFARGYGRSYFEAVADVAASEPCDLVLFTGDLLDDDEALAWTGPVLGRLRGRLGQFAILGNHDLHHHPDVVAQTLENAGFRVIEGCWTTVQDGGRSIALGGTSAPWGPLLDPNQRPAADATIVLSHTPDLFPAIARWGAVDLVLSGHNHAGQVRLPIFGPVIMPSRYGRRYDRGLFTRGRTTLEVTQGVGGKHPIRYGCRPEIVRITLRRGLP